MRGHNPFLERHGDGWRFRVRFPSRLAGFLNRGDLRLHLGRIDRREAHRRARLMRSDADNLFVALGTMMDVRKAQEAIQEWKRGWAAKFATRLLADGRMFISAEETSSLAADTFSLDLLLRSGLQIDAEQLEGSIGRALAGFPDEQRELEPVVQAGLRAAGITGETPSNVRALLTTAVLKAYGEMQRQIVAVGRGDASIADILQCDCAVSEVETRAETNAASNPVAAAATPGRLSAVGGAGASETRHPAKADLGFSPTWERFVADKIDITREWKPSRRPELAGTCRVWSWIVGPKSPSLIAKADLAQFRSIFLQLPAGYSRKPDYADTSASDTVKAAQAADRKYERVSVKTFNKHLSTLKAYFGWLKTQGLLPVDLEPMFSGLFVKPKAKGRAGRGERNQYSDDELKLIFSSPVWLGRHSERRLTTPGAYINRDSLYWGPLLAAFQGARREELAQVCVRHFIQIEGIWVINMNAPDLNLKSADGYEDEGSRRLLPLHGAILKLGFLEACVFGRDSDERLFPELNNENAAESFGAALGKRFGNYQRAMKFFPGTEGGFHRFRHTFITRLENTEAKTSFVEELTGHESRERRSERARYTKEIYVRNLKKTIDLLVLPIDVDALLANVARCQLPEKLRPQPVQLLPVAC